MYALSALPLLAVAGWMTILLIDTVEAFQARVSSSPRIRSLFHQYEVIGQSVSRRPWALQSSKDDEIAKLEEQLKRLKEEKDSEKELQVAPQNGQVVVEEAEEVPIAMFLSEGWKEKEAAESSDGGGGGILTTLAGVLALAVGLAVFSQVPVGQEDLSRYSAIKAPTEQIDLGDLNKARRSGGDL